MIKGVRVLLFVLAGALLGNPVVAQSLPDGWATSDVGAVGVAGSGSGTGDAFTVSGAGADIWGSADAFRFVYTSLTGNGSIVTQVTTVDPVNAWTKAGVMMRESLSPGSRHALMLVSAGKGLAFQRRTSTGGTSSNTAGPLAGAPYFVRLTRSGTTITAARSVDGQAWTSVGSATISMAETIYVGLAVSSHVAGTLATATFANTVITGTVAPSAPPATGTTTGTLVFFRHGEKPSGGYGQITCQGLRRALALPDVLLGQFGTPKYLVAPNPAITVTDAAGSFNYVRPLATIEPTAIRLTLPVNTQFGYNEIAGLQSLLTSDPYRSSTVFISWEHEKLVDVVQSIMNLYGGGQTVPAWISGDYDALYIVHLTTTNGATTATFERQFEGLNGLATSCPQ